MNNITLIIVTLILSVALAAIYKLFVAQKKTSQAWLHYATKANSTKAGTFIATDKTSDAINLEWRIMNARSPELLATMKELGDFMAQNWTAVEVNYLRAHPEEVTQQEHLQAFRPLFERGIEQVDWQKVNVLMSSMIKSMVEIDPKDFFGEHDISIFVFAKDPSTNKLLGFIQYLVKQDYPYGTVNLGNLAVDETARNRGLGKLLTSTIFKLLPKTERIFLFTRPTNTTAQSAYKAYGFKISKQLITDPIFAHGWLMMEYKVHESAILQNAAKKL